jgi:pimeloyl-ACP methyl ester carboxylesterase
VHATHFIANGDIQTAFHETGSGEPFVLVHGFTGSKLDFHDQLESFEDLGRAIAYDQRGHGESSNLGPYNFARLVSDLIGFLDQMELQQCNLLGHSLGGMIAMRAVLKFPDRFRSLILMDTAAEPLQVMPERAEIREQINRLVMAQGADALLQFMRGQPASRAMQRGVDYLGETEHWRRIKVKLSQLDPESFIALGQELNSYQPLTNQLAAISCPTTVVVGERDLPFVEQSNKLVAAIPNAGLATIAFAAHNPQYENADAWRDAVRAHLTRLST